MKASAIVLALALSAGSFLAQAQVAQGTAFTFQGVLQQSGLPLDGTPNLEFRLFDSTLAPTGPILTKSNWPVSNGQLTVELDFGGVFNGQARFLQITVNGTVLSPLLPISSTPYALSAQSTVPNSVNGLSVVNGALGSADIDASMQRRVSGTCAGGNAIRAVDAAGAVTCEPVGSGAGGGDITAVNTPPGAGLYGGATSGEVSLAIVPGGVTSEMIADGTIQAADVNPLSVQRRVSSSCSSGNAISAIDSAGNVSCQPAGIQALQAVPGGGLQIYLENGAYNANIANAGVTAAKIAPDAVTSAKILDNSIVGADIANVSIQGVDIQDGSIGTFHLQANSVGPAQLANNAVGVFQINAAQVQARVNGACADGSTMQSVNQDGSVSCAKQWGLFGNSGTTANHFVGTIDGAPLRLQGGTVGVNTPAPLTSLHVRAGPLSLDNGAPDPGTIINAERSIGNAFISIMGGVGQQRGLIFGEPFSAADGGIFYDNGAANLMEFRTGGNVVRALLGVNDIDGAGGDGAVANLRLRGSAGGISYISTTGTGASSRMALGFEGATSRVQIHPTYTAVGGSLIVDNGLQLTLGNLEVQSGTGLKPGGGSWGIYSDARLKHQVEPLESALDRLLALRGVSYEYLPSDSPLRPAGRHDGFIAQEVREVFPEWVGEAKDGYLYVSPKGFEALAVEALRDLKARHDVELEDLRGELAELRREVAAMRAAPHRN